uniref:Ig-like domain-containing protein n=1 Tax=Dicentrarchus labrax TaxID=13489 RepID=A0A8C4IKP2_DICLA
MVLFVSFPNRASLTLQPNWPQIFSGETITYRCEIDGVRDTQWTYEWEPTSSNTQSPTHSEYRIISATVSHSGDYRCKGRKDSYSSTDWSNAIRLNVSRKAILTLEPNWPQIFSGETVTFKCQMGRGGDTQWTYERRTSSSKTKSTKHSEYRIIAQWSHSGIYRCKGRRDSYSSTEWSYAIRLNISGEADDTDIPVGGSVTLTCSVNPSSSGWKYFWYRGKKTSEPLTTPDVVFLSTGQIRVSQGGLYWCRGGRGDPVYYTEYSDPITANKAVVTLQPNWSEIYRGEKITLRCEIKDGGDTEWTYEWKTTSSKKPSNQNEHSIRSATVSHSGEYRCKGRMKHDQQSSTDWSDPIKLTVLDSNNMNPPVSLKDVSPDRVQHFTSDSVSVNCEGNSAEWRVRRFKDSYWSHCSSWGTMTGSTCNIDSNQQSDAVYWCESGSGEFSNAVNITKLKTDIILLSPVHPVTEGDSISLSCRLRRQTFESNVFFYLNEKLIQNDTRRELNISAVSKSDEGFYKCQYSQQVSAQSWMSVNVSRPESSSSPVPLIVGLVCGIILIILLLLLYRYRPSKGENFFYCFYYSNTRI